MTCFDELTLSIYGDGELPPGEAQLVHSHLALCESCRARVAALRTESLSLGATLREVAYELPAREAASPIWVFLAVAAAALVGVAVSLDALRQLAFVPEWLGLDPLDPVVTLAFLFLDSGLTRLQEGVPSMPPMLPILVMVLLAFGALRLVRGRAAAMALLLASLATAAQATEVRFPAKGSNTVVIGPGETVDDTLLAAGDTIVIRGRIEGDLIALGRETRVEGEVAGSVHCLAKRLEITGTVQGDVYTMNETLSLRGRVKRSAHAMTQNTELEAAATVERDLFALAREVRVAGNLGRRLSASTQFAEITGTVGGKAEVNAERIHLSDSARIAGDLRANLPTKESASIGTGARIEGQTHIDSHQVHGPRNEVRRFLDPSFYLWQSLWLAAALLCGSLLRWFAPVLLEERPTSLLHTAGVGFIALVVTPVAVVLAGLTVVGLPSALLVLGGWTAALYLAGILVSAWIGRRLLRRETNDTQTFLLALLVGQVVLRVVKPLPWLGSLAGFAVLVLGLGLAVAAGQAALARVRGLR